jgi:dihydrofolate reductase
VPAATDREGKSMRRLIMFNSISLDGYFADRNSRMDWAHPSVPDREWDDFVSGNAGGGGTLVFGRITYEWMAAYWPTPRAAEDNPAVAEGMNRSEKIVFSRTLRDAAWARTRIVREDPADEIRRLKETPGPDMAILGSGSIVARLAPVGLIDSYQLVVTPVALGGGRTLFAGLPRPLALKLAEARRFANGNVVLTYVPA